MYFAELNHSENFIKEKRKCFFKKYKKWSLINYKGIIYLVLSRGKKNVRFVSIMENYNEFPIPISVNNHITLLADYDSKFVMLLNRYGEEITKEEVIFNIELIPDKYLKYILNRLK